MPMMDIAYAVIGLIGGYIFRSANAKKYEVVEQAVKNKQELVFLQTENGCYARRIVKAWKSLGFTDKNEFVIMPQGALKPCLNMGNLRVGHGDLHRAILIPSEILEQRESLKAKGLNDEEIGEFFSLVEKKKKGKIKDSELVKAHPWLEETYIAMPTTVSHFIKTGLNRVALHEMFRILVAEREVENLNRRNWLGIAILALLVLVGLGIFAKNFLPALAEYVKATAAAGTIPPVK